LRNWTNWLFLIFLASTGTAPSCRFTRGWPRPVCVCVCVCMCACEKQGCNYCQYLHTHTQNYTRTHTHTQSHTDTHAHTVPDRNFLTCNTWQLSTFTTVHSYICVYVGSCVCMCVCVCLCVSVCADKKGF
jgi:hypothetical protein